uniref:Uncharacterized protein n=1 Tax=Chenopodium quinoa TaxID=63459 RepID=A0A803M8P7_CHEQI
MWEMFSQDIHHFLGVPVGLASVIEHEMTEYKEIRKPAIITAGFFALLASILSIVLIFQHLRAYNNPAEQKWIVSVLLIVPIYATESIISLSNPKTSLACDILRNCYEAYALYAFGSYLISCLGGEERVLELLRDESRNVLNKSLLEEGDTEPALSRPSSFRNFFLRPTELGEQLFSIIKFGLFYNVTHEKLKPIKPLAKFISFKAIVFATWWQGVGIVLLCTLGVLPKDGIVQTGLQDFLICIEMAVAAIAHVYVFSAKAYHFIPISEYGKISTRTEKTVVDIEKGKDKGPTMIEKTETEVKAPGTSISESVQDIFREGGQQVVEDVKLTINQAIEPVEKGVTKIQESFHQITVGSEDKKESDVEIEERVEDDQQGVHKSQVTSEKMKVTKTVNGTS